MNRALTLKTKDSNDEWQEIVLRIPMTDETFKDILAKMEDYDWYVESLK
jgi:hypothetical protein